MLMGTPQPSPRACPLSRQTTTFRIRVGMYSRVPYPQRLLTSEGGQQKGGETSWKLEVKEGRTEEDVGFLQETCGI